MRERLHGNFAQGDEGRRGAHGEVLPDIQMDAQRIGEQRRGFVNLALHFIGHLLLKDGITTLDDGRPREVISVCK